MEPFNWTCKFCSTAQTVVEKRCNYGSHDIYVGESKHGQCHIARTATICCANPECCEPTVTFGLYANEKPTHYSSYDQDEDLEIIHDTIRPNSAAKVQPDYIPSVLTEDYYEACKILRLSPKASATLTRRCLQGMIRNFCQISKPTLFKEIEELKNAYEEDRAPKGVTDETVEAIDYVRTIGNIGAHMEKDIDKIIEIDPGEAEALIGLVELLFEEWYVARHQRQEKLQRIKAIKVSKDEKKKELASNEEIITDPN